MKARLLRGGALALLTFVLGVGLLGMVLVSRGEEAMERSDAAFHSGKLRDAVIEAKSAGLAYVPGGAHVERAEQRLEAIARGAESEADMALARAAWDALRIVDEQTRYPGRGPSASGERARAALLRLDQARSMDSQVGP